MNFCRGCSVHTPRAKALLCKMEESLQVKCGGQHFFSNNLQSVIIFNSGLLSTKDCKFKSMQFNISYTGRMAINKCICPMGLLLVNLVFN